MNDLPPPPLPPEIQGANDLMRVFSPGAAERLMQAYAREAMATERERCAAMVDEVVDSLPSPSHPQGRMAQLAALIRAGHMSDKLSYVREGNTEYLSPMPQEHEDFLDSPFTISKEKMMAAHENDNARERDRVDAERYRFLRHGTRRLLIMQAPNEGYATTVGLQGLVADDAIDRLMGCGAPCGG